MGASHYLKVLVNLCFGEGSLGRPHLPLSLGQAEEWLVQLSWRSPEMLSPSEHKEGPEHGGLAPFNERLPLGAVHTMRLAP